jgi:glycosyltransferase involved in cell wall biosynthesis
MSPLISIIIPTKNEARNISRCLTSIVNNGYKNFEIIVVDQNSTDSTREIVKKFPTKFITTPATSRYLPPSQSRNLGFSVSTGKFIYHVDADMELVPGLLSEIVSLLSQPEVSAVVVPEIDIPNSFWAKGKAFERSLYFNTDMEAARATTRKIFSQVMYDKSITSGEDWYIHDRYQKLGKIARTKVGVKHYIGSISLSKEFKKKLHYGTQASSFLDRQSSEVSHRFATLCGLYIRGIIRGIFVTPLAVFAFIVIRFVDLLALFMGVFISSRHE